MTEYIEGETENEPLSDVLNALAGGKPFVFLVADVDSEANVRLSCEVGGGIRDGQDVRHLLELALKGMP